MNAHKFVAEHGVERAREVLEGAPDFPIFGYCSLTGSYIFERKHANAYYHNETNSWSEEYAIELIVLEDLKQVVESVEQINVFDRGLVEAKEILNHINESGNKYARLFEKTSLEKAIADYELVESFKLSNTLGGV